MFQILVIDDDPVIQMVLQKLLHGEGYQVTTASSGPAGIAAAESLRPALIICDWLMNGMDGLAVCRQIKADPQLASAFFILLTSRAEIADRVLGLDTGADDFLPKPIEINELRARVRSGLRLYQSSQELQQLAQDLQTQKERLEAEFAEAAAYVRSRLPQPLTGSIATETRFLPSSQLGGDCFDHFWLDPDFLALYLLDVSGHGLGSALLSVSVQNILRSQSLPEVNFYQPSTVLSALNEIFEMDKHHDRYFTLWYGVYNRQKRHLLYASAGHPPAVLLSPSVEEFDDQPPVGAKQLRTRGMPIGMMPESQYRTEGCEVPPGSTLFVFSDGVYEIMQPDKTPWSLDEFITMLTTLYKTGEDSLDQILQTIQSINGNTLFQDDCSLMQIKFE
ncbi:SpoIIE family protein phosphatase [Phormidium tenue FACHB-886]|nr:SpoIIE family protein phosphatase [Phormidium tenue FACHB-886]